ncbi:MAG TPA: hypothetical protein VE987_01955 [Polyangiaceae bacterium]|nr:hypothetical protein [Polyangiaceae bacterium]
MRASSWGEPGPARRAARALWPLALLLAGCGYRAVYGGEPSEKLCVHLARTLVADAVASDEVASGAREALARDGALDGGDCWPRVEIEVLRADEASEGVVARSGAPAARATRVSVLGRAWIARAAGSVPEHDTGDLRASEVIAVDLAGGMPDPRAGELHYTDALRAAARRLGGKLARKVTGQPAASDDPE